MRVFGFSLWLLGVIAGQVQSLPGTYTSTRTDTIPAVSLSSASSWSLPRAVQVSRRLPTSAIPGYPPSRRHVGSIVPRAHAEWHDQGGEDDEPNELPLRERLYSPRDFVPKGFRSGAAADPALPVDEYDPNKYIPIHELLASYKRSMAASGKFNDIYEDAIARMKEENQVKMHMLRKDFVHALLHGGADRMPEGDLAQLLTLLTSHRHAWRMDRAEYYALLLQIMQYAAHHEYWQQASHHRRMLFEFGVEEDLEEAVQYLGFPAILNRSACLQVVAAYRLRFLFFGNDGRSMYRLRDSMLKTFDAWAKNGHYKRIARFVDVAGENYGFPFAPPPPSAAPSSSSDAAGTLVRSTKTRARKASAPPPPPPPAAWRVAVDATAVDHRSTRTIDARRLRNRFRNFTLNTLLGFMLRLEADHRVSKLRALADYLWKEKRHRLEWIREHPELPYTLMWVYPMYTDDGPDSSSPMMKSRALAAAIYEDGHMVSLPLTRYIQKVLAHGSDKRFPEHTEEQ